MVRIGTWNLENLFLPGTPSGPTTREAYDRKLAGLAATITALDVDTLAVQEVGDPAALADLAALLDGYPHLATADPDDRGIRVGVLSRLPLTDVEQVTTFPPRLNPVQVDDVEVAAAMGRPALAATVTTTAGTAVTVLTCHLKSKLLSFPNGAFSTRDEDLRARTGAYALFRRAAEAATVRVAATRLLDGRGQDRALVVLGDLNDGPDAATTQLLNGPPGSELGSGGFDVPDRGDGARLWNLATLIPVDERWSRDYRGTRELIDHVLVSHRAVRVVTAVTAGAPGGAVPPAVGDSPAARVDAPASDHRPIVVTLDL